MFNLWIFYCSSALLLCCYIGIGHTLWVAFVFVAATFTVASFLQYAA